MRCNLDISAEERKVYSYIMSGNDLSKHTPST